VASAHLDRRGVGSGRAEPITWMSQSHPLAILEVRRILLPTSSRVAAESVWTGASNGAAGDDHAIGAAFFVSD